MAQKISAVLFGLLLVVLLEGVLLLSGVLPLTEEDRFVGFSGNAQLFVPGGTNADGTNYKLNPNKSSYFNLQTFRMPKPEGVFRIVTLGGSTTYGRPYLGETAFARWLTDLGNTFAGPQTYESINAGGISYASYRAARLLKETVNYDPDLFVVYSGHNEFLEARTFANLKAESSSLRKTREWLHRSRLYSLLERLLASSAGTDSRGRSVLPDEVSVELETIVGPDSYHRDEDFRRGVLQQYRSSIQGMIDLARDKQTPLVLCTLPANLSGVSPFKSEHRQGLSGREFNAWNRLFDEGNHLLQQGDAEGAVQVYREALQIDSRYALLHFRLGQALLLVGQKERAYQAFVRAKQEDIIPLRALEEMNAAVRELAAANGVPLADVAAMFRRIAANGIPGADLFDDHVHPNIRGQQLIAWVVFDTMVKEKLIPLHQAQWQEKVQDARQLLLEREAEIPDRYRALGVWGVGRLYFWAGKYPEAYVSLKQAWQVLKDIPEIPMKLGALEVFRGDGEAALPLLEKALQLDPGNPNVLVMMANAQILQQQGHQALELLARLPADRESSVGFLSARGRALMLVGERAAGLEVLRRALELAPEAPRPVREYAEALAGAGELAEAKKMYGRYLQMVRASDPEETLQRWVAQKGWQRPRQWLNRERGMQ